MFEKSWTDAILSSLLWFFYRHLNGSSEYIRAPNQRSIPLLHFPPKRLAGIICFTTLFPSCFTARKWIRLEILDPVSREKILGVFFQRWGKCGRRNEDVLDAEGVHLGTDLFIQKIGENCLRMQNIVFLPSKNFIKDNIWFCSQIRLFPNKLWVVTVYMQMLLYI